VVERRTISIATKRTKLSKKIGIDHLDIDPLNVRRTKWNRDPELIESIRRYGVRVALIVRPYPNDPKKYGIVCGSRRFNAAMDAGLEEVPCEVFYDMTDEEARIVSFSENYHRKMMETWETIEEVGQMRLQASIDDESDPVTYISHLYSISVPTIKKYLAIYNLPEDIKGLIRPFQDRTRSHVRFLERNPHIQKNQKLSIGNAAVIARNMQSFTENNIDLRETAVFFLGKTERECDDLTMMKLDNPQETWQTLYDNIVEQKVGYRQISFSLLLDDKKLLDFWCERKNRNYRDLLRIIVKNWLRTQGPLPTSR
jgi:ParB/RepB/Spo0J family partition protein